MQCSRCGHDLASSAKFCTSCGTTAAAAPTPPSDTTAVAPDAHAYVEIGQAGRRSVVPFVMTAVVFAALVAGGIAVIGTRDNDDGAAGGRAGGSVPVSTPPTATTPASTDVTTTPTTTTPTSTTETSTTTTSTTTTSTLPPDPDALALTGLAETIDADRLRVDTHLGRWVPQLSAKRDGTRWEGVDYDLAEILSLHRELDARYGTLLVSGADYNFQIDDSPMVGWFITIVDQSHPIAEGALDWCRLNAIDRENCAAKLITNDQDAGGTLVLQERSRRR